MPLRTQSLNPTLRNTLLSADLQQTVTLSRHDVAETANHNGIGISSLELRLPASSTNISQDFNESTRKLLHRRLLITATSALCLLLTLKILGLSFADTTLRDFLLRMSTAAVLVGIIAFLYRTPQATLRRLRMVEALGGITLTVDMVWVLIVETQVRIATGHTGTLPTQFMTISFAFAIFIAVFGMFIPGNWRRTAPITCMSALVPTVTAMILRQSYPSLQQLEGFPGFIAPTLTMMMALIAAQAAHVVHQIRREVETAKQYGQYELLEKIGQGGRGVVYKAKHRLLKRPAAIKLIRSEIANDPNTVRDFEHEVQLSAELTHWNSVQIYDYGRTDEGDFYCVMEYLKGETLRDRIDGRGKLSNKETVDIIGQVCDGLQEAHSKGMVHRDIKPDNVFLSDNRGQHDVVKILDFGFAAMRSETDRLKRVSGTPLYISPEQLRSESVDERCDIYALGCVIFECLSGQHLFIADSLNEMLLQHLHHSPSLEGLPGSAKQFRDIIIMCVEKSPDRRFPNVVALKKAIDRCV